MTLAFTESISGTEELDQLADLDGLSGLNNNSEVETQVEISISIALRFLGLEWGTERQLDLSVRAWVLGIDVKEEHEVVAGDDFYLSITKSPRVYTILTPQLCKYLDLLLEIPRDVWFEH